MEPRSFSQIVNVQGPYNPSLDPLSDEFFILDGANCLLRGSNQVPESCSSPGTGIVNVENTAEVSIAVTGTTTSNTYGKLMTGNIVAWRNGSVFYIGSGSVYYGSAMSFDMASSTLKVRLNSGSFYAVGLAAPLAPTLSTAVGGTKMRGTYSCCISEANSDTGWESNAGPRSNVRQIDAPNQASVVFPASINAFPRANGRYIYFTPRGLGTIGPYRRLGGFIPFTGAGSVAEAGGSKSFDFNDNELSTLFQAPVENDPPPDDGGTHCIAFDSLIVILGTYMGAGISPSEPNNSGSYDPLKTNFASPFEKILCVWPRPTDGYALFATTSSLQALYVVGGDSLVAVRTLWGNDGVPGGMKAGCFAGGTFYCWSKGPSRVIQGNDIPDVSFAADVWDLLRRQFSPETVTVGYDPLDRLVVYCGQMSTGRLAGQWVGFSYRLTTGGWNPPVVLTGQPKGAITLDRLYLVIDGALCPWNAGAGPIGGWFLLGAGQQFSAPGRRKVLQRMTAMASAGNVTTKIFTGLNYSTVRKSWTAGTGDYGEWEKARIKASIFSVEFSGGAMNERPEAAVLEGYIDPKRRR